MMLSSVRRSFKLKYRPLSRVKNLGKSWPKDEMKSSVVWRSVFWKHRNVMRN
ncbi:hypothetical protein D3C76_1649520 [compost metagenome]